MHIKFLKTKGNAKAAVDYVIRKSKPKKTGEEVETLKGNPDTTADLGMSLGFKYTYSSAVIRWHPSDKPTPEQIEEVLDAFERFAFAGLNKNQYNMLVIQHTENGQPHLHIIVPRIELQSGKSLNIAPPKFNADRTKYHEFDHLRDYYNEKYGWKSPNILQYPENARVTQHGPNHDNRKELTAAIDYYVNKMIKAGLITDRATLVTELEITGLVVTRTGEDYITVLNQNDKTMKKGLRLKGEPYSKGFSVKKGITKANTEATSPSLDQLAKSLDEQSKRRAQYHIKRYGQMQNEPHQDVIVHTPEVTNGDSNLSSSLHEDMRHCMASNTIKNSGSTSQQLNTQLQSILNLLKSIAKLLSFNSNSQTQGAQYDRNRDQAYQTIASAEQANGLTKRNIERASAGIGRAAKRTAGNQYIFSAATRSFEHTAKLLDRLETQEKSSNFNNYLMG